MSYRFSVVRSAEKEFLNLPVSTRGRIKAKLLALETKPRPQGCKKLRESEKHRIRIGDYRVLYLVTTMSSFFPSAAERIFTADEKIMSDP